ncbi:MAG: hypothetical protein Q8K66_04010 [Sediminibacterium sp.]|nr:hypothetical protein [Sediminibacterium sp.]MDP3128104.1 hypothetical protein [Sediminibacterium sp.]MDP3667150.1 hypothetical protein [Sediminibacterium sp.]
MKSGSIKIFIQEKKGISERIYLSSGSEVNNSIYYEPNSYVPTLPWRKVSKKEISELIVYEGDKKNRNVVSVIKIPTSLISIADEIGIKKLKKQSDIEKAFRKNESKLNIFNTELNLFLKSLEIKKNKTLHGLFVAKPQVFETVAKLNNHSRLMGLHIDNTLSSDAFKAHNTPNRVCINFGVEDRYLLFVDKTVKELITLISSKIDITEHIKRERLTESFIVRNFFTLFPDYPVIKLRVKANEAYIAPTDNAIHDGSLTGKRKADICLVVLGYFSPFKRN